MVHLACACVCSAIPPLFTRLGRWTPVVLGAVLLQLTTTPGPDTEAAAAAGGEEERRGTQQVGPRESWSVPLQTATPGRMRV